MEQQRYVVRSSVLCLDTVQRQSAEAIPEYETAIALNRNSVVAIAAGGRYKIYIGSIDERIASVGLLTSDIPVGTFAPRPASFREFRGGTVDLAPERVGGSEVSINEAGARI